MISFINSWTQGIVVAVIISGVIEMILPKGSIKKYIHVIIGIYILFAIVSPITDKVSNKDINQLINIDQYAKQIETTDINMTKTLETNSSRTIKDIYISNLEIDIKNNMKLKGYDVKRLFIRARDDEKYTIEDIEITVTALKETTKSKNKIQIDDIIISDFNKTNNSENLSEEEIIKIQNYIAETYHLDKSIIKVD